MSGAGLPADDWEQHWEHYAASAERNPAQRYRCRLIASLLAAPAGRAHAGAAGAGASVAEAGPAATRVLDIGSGQGDLARYLRVRMPLAQIAGLELSASGCEIARRKVPGATFLQRNLLEPQSPDELAGWATHAVCSEVLEHVDHPQALLTNARAYLAPGCRLVVTVPGGPMSAFDRHIGHRRHYRPSSLRRLLEESGFAVDRCLAAGFPFHNLYRLAVIARGDRLAEDVDQGDGTDASVAARVAMAAFDALFRMNLASTPWGWQMAATAVLAD